MTLPDVLTARFALARRAVLVSSLCVFLLAPSCASPGGEGEADAQAPASQPGAEAPETEAPPAPRPRPPARGDVSGFAFAVEDAPRYTSEGVRVATFNTEFLFDGLEGEGQTGFERSGDPEAARAHRDQIGRVLRMIDADVVMLQEVENKEVVESLVEESLQEMNYQVYFVQGNDYFTGQDLALLSRLPVEEVGRTDERARVGASRDDYGVSKNLYARLRLAGEPVTLIGVHFLARPDDASRKDKREAQAEVIRRLVEKEEQAGRQPVVLGDFNDFDDQTPDLAGSTPITDVLATIKRAGPGPADDLRPVMAEVPQRDRYTSFYDRNQNDTVDGREELSSLDHILLPPALYRHLREVNFVQAHDPVTVSDHFPIVVSFGEREARPSEPAPRR